MENLYFGEKFRGKIATKYLMLLKFL